MKNISELTEQEIEILAATWALKFQRPQKSVYEYILKEVKEGKRPIENIPYFAVMILIEWGYFALNNLKAVSVRITIEKEGTAPEIYHNQFSNKFVRDEYLKRLIAMRNSDSTLLVKDERMSQYQCDDAIYSIEAIDFDVITMEDLDNPKYQHMYWKVTK